MARLPWIGTRTLESFRRPGYPWLWLSVSLNGYANMVSQIVIGWLALELSGSPLGVGIALASRAIPRLVLSIPFGVLSDRYDRRIILGITNFFGAAVAAAAAVASMTGSLQFAALIAVAVLVGVFDVSETSVSRALVYDLVGPELALNGISLVSLADKLFGVLGALSAGILLKFVGAGGAFWAMSGAFFFSSLTLLMIKLRFAAHPGSLESPSEETAEVKSTVKWMAFIGQNSGLMLLAGVAVTMEVFAFSSDSLLPSFARDVLRVGESGLGLMSAVRSVGGVLGVLLLAAFSTKVRQGPLLLGICILFGLGLIAFAGSPSFILSLAVLLFVGGMWAGVDALLPTLLQYCVKDSERGTAVGVWNLSRGFGPLGHLEIGGLAGFASVPLAQMINGFLLILIVAVIGIIHKAKGLRWASSGQPSQSPSL